MVKIGIFLKKIDFRETLSRTKLSILDSILFVKSTVQEASFKMNQKWLLNCCWFDKKGGVQKNGENWVNKGTEEIIKNK